MFVKTGWVLFVIVFHSVKYLYLLPSTPRGHVHMLGSIPDRYDHQSTASLSGDRSKDTLGAPRSRVVEFSGNTKYRVTPESTVLMFI